MEQTVVMVASGLRARRGRHGVLRGLTVAALFTLVGGIPTLPPTTCPGCVSHSWQCDRRCVMPPTSGVKYGFDFTYIHPQNSCHEAIPYNQSTMLIDADLYCLFPKARTCRDRRCRDPLIGCDNMNDFTFNGLSLLKGCQNSTDGAKLMRENCQWACKHFRPFARCSLQFDPSGAHRMSQQLKACWVTETCNGSRTTGVRATCQPDVAPVVNVVEVSGSFQLSVGNAASLIGASKTKLALQSALASSLDGVNASMVRIDSIAASRRLRSLDNVLSPTLGRLLASFRALGQAVTVKYTIIADEQTASAVSSAVGTTALTDLTSNITTALASEGISVGAVAVSSIATPTAAMKTGAELQNSTAELAALRSMKNLVDKHLQEAIEELNATRNELQNKSLIENATLAQLQDLQSSHQSANNRLQELIMSHTAMQERVRNTTTLHDQTHGKLEEALAEKAIASSKLENAKSSLTAAQLQLASAQVYNNETQDRLDESLKNHNLTLEQLAKLDSSHSSVVQELNALNANHTKALKQLADVRAHRDAALTSTLEAERAQNKTKQNLETAKLRNKLSQDSLRMAAFREQQLDQQLSVVSTNLTMTRSDLAATRYAHNSTRVELRRTRVNLVEALRAHSETQNALEKEQADHAKTKKDLESERASSLRIQKDADAVEEELPAKGILLGVVGGLSLLVLVLSLSLCFVYSYRKHWLFTMLHANNANAGAGDVVVMGRPMGAGVVVGDHGSQKQMPDDPPSKGRSQVVTGITGINGSPPLRGPTASEQPSSPFGSVVSVVCCPAASKQSL